MTTTDDSNPNSNNEKEENKLTIAAPKTDATHASRHKYSISEFEPQQFAVEQENDSSFRHTETPYLHFLHDQRKLILENENIQFDTKDEFHKYMKQKWDELEDTIKASYFKRARDDDKRFNKALGTNTYQIQKN